MYKNNSRESSKFKCFSPLQSLCIWIMNYPAIAYFEYTNRYQQAVEGLRQEAA